ncbi:transcriptional regulator NrdR [Coleofasciculus chthonoplastes PCC 7420]|uniref:Transcriptional repressor NrdR n=1 Tax=Coleofasciculus chthonoplastes PCC 7420 TaxID=118168 RepID=B4VZV7_9CYAN|nr:transcriptional regulator NrdR [Coleofasciculus chthonoplastes]EDX72456.1 transcriptional regulator NrdR [Coleofasciculus chthonoplastes PCC 7420]
MRCPYCQHTDSRVLESRSTEAGQSVRRRRECLLCKHRFTTYERIEFVPITVLKRDGKRESFDRSKLLRGMVRACEKTGVSQRRLEAIVDEIEAEVQQHYGRDVNSDEVGELVLRYLQHESEVAYVRFASVYRKFQGIRDFIETLEHLRNNTELDNPEISPIPPAIPNESDDSETSASLVIPTSEEQQVLR